MHNLDLKLSCKVKAKDQFQPNVLNTTNPQSVIILNRILSLSKFLNILEFIYQNTSFKHTTICHRAPFVIEKEGYYNLTLNNTVFAFFLTNWYFTYNDIIPLIWIITCTNHTYFSSKNVCTFLGVKILIITQGTMYNACS